MVNLRLEKTIEKGMWRFVLLYGVGGMGVLFPASEALWDYWAHGADFWGELSRSLKRWPLMGLGFGLYMWWGQSSSYKKQKRAEERAGQ